MMSFLRAAGPIGIFTSHRLERRMGWMEAKKTKEQNLASMNRHHPTFDEIEYADNIGGTLLRIIKYFSSEKFMLVLMIAVVIFGTLCGVGAPALQSRAIDMIAGTREGSFSKTLTGMLLLYMLYSLCQLLQGLFSARLSQGIVKRMRQELFGKIVDLPVSYLDVHSHGDVMSRMTNDIENISTTISQSLPSLFSGVLTIIGTVSIMLWYCWQLALLSFGTVFLTLISTKLLSAKVRKFSRKRQMLLGQLNGTVEEMISGYRTVVAYNHQDITTEAFCKTADSMTKAGIRTDIFSGIMGPIMNCIGNIGFVIIAAFGGYFSLSGMISVGVISAFIVYAKQFSRPINEIAQIYGQLQTAIAGAERVFLVLDEKNEDKSGEELKEQEKAEVIFKNINFSYKPGNPVISDFSLTVPSGKKIALVGATGSGKTTIVNLLMRFYDIDSGEILINRQNIKEVSRDSLRKHIAIVLQDTVLFTDTVWNNLKYAKESVTEEQMENAVEMSRCKEMIGMLPQGYDTVLTGAGENISQGQRQLLAIARAFVADPDILILDEATSNVDTRTEKAIQSAMQQIMQNRTSIVIAHRLSTIRDSDMIVVMDHGSIVEIGNHDELLAKMGRYYELYMTQFAGVAT
jgi:ATP-binding cassette subfamily B protein